MKTLLVAGALALAGLAVSGCSAMQGMTAFNSALVPELKSVDAKIHTDTTCGDMAAQVLGVTAGQLSATAAVSIVQFCERRDATQTLMLDPQGARRVLEGILNKPAVPIAGSPVGAAVGAVAGTVAP